MIIFRSSSDWLSKFGAVAAAILGGVASIAVGFTDYAGGRTSKISDIERLTTQIEVLSLQQQDLTKTQVKIEAQLTALSKPLTEEQASAVIVDLQNQVSAMRDRFNLIDTAINENPQKAMSLPLIRKDLENVTADALASKVDTQAQIDRMYDLFKWFIPAFGALVLSILGLAFKR